MQSKPLYNALLVAMGVMGILMIASGVFALSADVSLEKDLNALWLLTIGIFSFLSAIVLRLNARVAELEKRR
ncbi:MAG: hypothetical protein JO089_03920 [Alphaproteobacteria bacterium]|nr:hypothetical protein [Alphaproteobacteria bacterium]